MDTRSMLLLAGLLAGAAACGDDAVDCHDNAQPARTRGSLEIDPTNDQVVYVGVEHEGFFKTEDGGATWRRIVEGFKSPAKASGGGRCYSEWLRTSIDPLDPSRVCTAMSGGPTRSSNEHNNYIGIYCTKDGGEQWTHRYDERMNLATNSVAVVPGIPGEIYAGVNGNPDDFTGELLNSTGTIYKTLDGGKFWREVPTGYIKSMRIPQIYVDPVMTNRIIAASFVLKTAGMNEFDPTQFGLLRSEDGGTSWSSTLNAADTRPEGSAMMEFAISPRDSDRLTVATGADSPPSVFVSIDRGMTFTAAVLDDGRDLYAQLVTYDRSDPTGMHIVALGIFTDDLYESADGGFSNSAVAKLPSELPDNPVRASRLV
jgi:photosystem II stability/assembly factor-like uncharacterized protein